MANKNSEKLTPENGCMVVRMYRQGLGDCYLLAFDRSKKADGAYYVLIDCGVHHRQDSGTERLLEVMDDITRATGGTLNLLIITHEHADHISGFIQKDSPFVTGELTINDVWFGWVEKPGDKQAQALERKRQEQSLLCEKLQTLIDKAVRKRQKALERQQAAGITSLSTEELENKKTENKVSVADTSIGHLKKHIETLIGFDEFSDEAHLSEVDIVDRLNSLDTNKHKNAAKQAQQDEDDFQHVGHDETIATSAPGLAMDSPSRKRVSRTKLAIALIKKKAQGKVSYLEPNDMRELTQVPFARAYVLGPPRDETLLKRDRPRKVRGSKGEHQETYMGVKGTSLGSSPALLATAKDSGAESLSHPFSMRIFGGNTIEQIQRSNEEKDPKQVNGNRISPSMKKIYEKYAPLVNGKHESNHWRSIDEDWLGDAGSLALSMESDTNNTSLVLAFELDRFEEGDVLLFAADAQVGNWLSWRNQDYRFKKRTVTTDDLLRRTLIYKVGHHGSHNATLRRDPRAISEEDEDYGLELMDNIIAMINVDVKAVEKEWPVQWKMPYKPLYERLREKSGRRVLRSDGELSPLPPDSDPAVTPKSEEFKSVSGLRGVKWRHSPAELKFKDNNTDLYYDIQIPYRRNR